MIQQTFEDVLQGQPQAAFSQKCQDGQQQRYRHKCQHDIRQGTISFQVNIKREGTRSNVLIAAVP